MAHDPEHSSATVDEWVIAATKGYNRPQRTLERLQAEQRQIQYEKVVDSTEDDPDPLPKADRSIGVPLTRVIYLAQGVLEEKSIGLQALEDHHLPRARKVTLTAAEFLENPTESTYQHLDSEKYYIILPPKDGKRRRAIDLTSAMAQEYVTNNIAPKERATAQIQVQEFFDNIYSGNITVNPDNSVKMEMGEGKHSYYVGGHRTPTIILERNQGSRALKGKQARLETHTNGEQEIVGWTELDEDLQILMTETFEKLPNPDDDYSSPQTTEKRAGYYEVALVKIPGFNVLKPIFLDEKDGANNPAYATKTQ